MSNYNIKTDLRKVRGAFVCNIKGKAETKACLCIPLDSPDLYSGERGVYLDLTAWETQNNQYGDTHMLRVRVSKDRYNAMSDEERRGLPIVGNMRPVQSGVEQQAAAQPAATAARMDDGDDDLPF